MTRSIVNPPSADNNYLSNMSWDGINVVGGVRPTGKFPKAVDSGIFGMESQDDGVFSGPSIPNSKTGIFYNDYAKDSWELQQPDLEWVMLRRPGRPLYPGSSSRGIVLIGPSMGTDETCQCQPSMFTKVLTGAAILGATWFLLNKMKIFSKGESR